MNKNKVFIFEFVSGGGFNHLEIPSSLFSEGYGMLRTIISDFKDLDFEIETLLDFRIDFLSRYLKADFINVVLNTDNYITKFEECVKKSRFCFIIAPEFSSILYNLTKIAIDKGAILLSIGLKGISLGTSKLNTYKFFKEKDISTPITFSIPYKKGQMDLEFIIEKFQELNNPIIIKPEDGVGAESIYYFETKGQILDFFSKSLNEPLDPNRSYILQEFIEGRDLSVSLIGKNNSINSIKKSLIVVGINSQFIDITSQNESRYLGGFTPVKDWEEIVNNLNKKLEKFELSPFNGYFGIDFILNPQKCLNFIEINPRLTTSYIGIRNIVNQNLVGIILNENGDDKIQFHYFSKFGHMNLKYTGSSSFEDINNSTLFKIMNTVPEIVTPPIKLNNEKESQKDYYSCFYATRTKNLESSESVIKKIKKVLEKYNFELYS